MYNFIDLSKHNNSANPESELVYFSSEYSSVPISNSGCSLLTRTENISLLTEGEEEEIKSDSNGARTQRNHLKSITNEQKSSYNRCTSGNQRNSENRGVDNCKTCLCKNGTQKSKIESLQKSNKDYQIDYRELERKYNGLVRELANANLDKLKLTPRTIQRCTRAKKKNEKIFSRDSTIDMDVSPADKNTVIEECCDIDMEQIEMELSGKDYEFQRHKKLKVVEERFKNKDICEKTIKRKLQFMESETERTTKRFKAIDEANEKLIDNLTFWKI